MPCGKRKTGSSKKSAKKAAKKSAPEEPEECEHSTDVIKRPIKK